LERLFFFAVVGSAVLAAELSAASAACFFDRLFLAGAAESSGAAVSALAVAFFFDFDFGVFVESAPASALLCEASAAAFFLLFFLVAVLLLSLWSVEPACCAPGVATPPQIRNIAAISAKTTLLFDLIGTPSLRFGLPMGRVHSQLMCAGGLGRLQACLAGIPQWNARIIPEKQGEVKVKGNA
jgi:hypothetical protein